MSVIKYKGTDGVEHELGLIVPLDGVLSDTSVNGVQNKIIKAALDEKQTTLTAGSNIAINNNVISATDTTYTAGTNINISNNTISALSDNSKLDATKCTCQTTAPTQAISDGGVHIVYLTSEPATRYSGYIYLILES